MSTDNKNLYLAGLFDAEGSINLYKTKTKTGFYVDCSISGTEHESMKKIYGIISSGYMSSYKPKNENYKTQYKIRLNCKSADLFLRNVSPYLLIKQKEALLSLELGGIIKNKGQQERVSDIIVKKRYDIYNKIQKIKKKRGRVKINCNNVSIDYLAGFFDGEGNVSIRKTNNRFTLLGCISNNNYDILNYYKKTFGGSLTKTKTGYNYVISANKALNMIRLLLPYCITKKRDIEKGIEFQNHMNAYDGRKYGVKGLPKNIFQERETMYKNLMNRYSKKR